MMDDDKEVLDWAGDMLCEITDQHAIALNLQGWRIVNKDDPDRRWPFDSKASIGFVCPDWCDDFSKPKAKPKLMVVEQSDNPTSDLRRAAVFTIEKNIAMPPPMSDGELEHALIKRSYYPFADMEIGNSFLLSGNRSDRAKLAKAASDFGRVTGKKFTVRTIEGGYRCWRIA